MAIQQLSSIRPDPQDLKAQLQAQLSTKKSWKDLLTSGVGETVLEFFASIGSYDQYSIERMFKEAFPQTARQDSSIYGSTRQLGVRLQRKSPAGLKFTLKNNSSSNITILPYTQMAVGGVKVFNRTQIIIPPGGPYNSDGANPISDAAFIAANGGSAFLPIQVYEGSVVTKFGADGFIGTGNDFQVVISAESGFVISDVDVQVFVNSVLLRRVTDGLWNYKVENTIAYGSQVITPVVGPTLINLPNTNLVPGSVVVPNYTVVTSAPAAPNQVQVDYLAGTLMFYTSLAYPTQRTATYRYYVAVDTSIWQDMTTAQGNVQVQFGNTYFGTKPAAGSTVELKYVITRGLSGNDASLGAQLITYSGQPANLILTSTTGLVGGADQIATRLYKSLAPSLFSAQERAVTQSDYNATALLYGTQIIDAVIQGQRDLDVSNNEYMNLARVWLIYYNDPSDVINPGNPWNAQDFNAFIDFLRKRSMYALRFFYDEDIAAHTDPFDSPAHIYGAAHAVPINVLIEATVACQNFADLNEVKSAVENAIDSFLALRKGSISRDIYVSDVYSTILKAHPAIDFINLVHPVYDRITNYETVEISATQAGGGAIPIGTYEYRVAAIFDTPEYPSTKETRATKLVVVTTTVANRKITLTWTPLWGATGYRIYGYLPGSPVQYLATTTNTVTFNNHTTGWVAGTPKLIDESGLRYPRKGNVTITTEYTYRQN